MTRIDPERERKRLAEFYAGQLDGELEKVAGEAYELSHLAREVLKAELQRRGLSVELAEHATVPVKKAPEPGDPQEEDALEADGAQQELPKADGEGDIDGMVTVRTFRDLPEALLAKGGLDSAGMKCALVDDNIVRMDWFWSNAMGGVKVLVNREDLTAAEEILAQPIPEHFDVSGVGEYEQPRCPKCGSLDINFRELQSSAYLSMALNVPIPFHRRAWRCHSCDVEWEDDGVPGPEESPA
jgi:hypothetical protein